MNFRELFKRKPIIGMIHLAGGGIEKISRALEELQIYQEEGLDGVIIENYHGRVMDVAQTLKESHDYRIIRGVNVLGDNSAALAMAHTFGAKFVQFDTVIGDTVSPEVYCQFRRRYSEICILGGVRFKYVTQTGKSLEEDIEEGRQRCEAIVTTGEGTGIETPIEKLKDFRKIMGGFPLIAGAGVNLRNVREQLAICDGAIVGSYFKPMGDTYQKVDRKLVKEFIEAANSAR